MNTFTYNQLNAKYQRDHNAKLRAIDPDLFKAKQAEKMREYRRKRKERDALLHPIVKVEEPIKTIDLTKYVVQQEKQTKGIQKAISNDIIPLYLRSNKEITETTLNDYLSKLNIIHKIFADAPLNTSQKAEIRKAIKGNKFDKSLIDTSYYNDISNVIKTLREKYANDNTFRGYINAISVLLSRIDDFKQQYQIIAKVNIDFSKSYNEERDKHIIADEDKNKLISFSPEEINTNIKKLQKIDDKLLYAFSVYLLRRLEIRFLKLSYEDNDKNENLLIIDKKYNPSVAIFNEYKTAKVFKKQVIEIPDEIKALVKEYLIKKNINIGDYVFGLERNRGELISQGNFSNKIKIVFNKLYDANITNRWIRMAYATETGGEMLEAVKKYETDAMKLSHSVKVHHQYVKRN